jgi:WD40 repeat protein
MSDGPTIAGDHFEAHGRATQVNAPGGFIELNVFAPSYAIRRPWVQRPLPVDGFVPRRAVTQQLLNVVLNTDDASAVIGIYGTGGFGKTTLATWLCSQPDIREHFTGGSLWITLGENIREAELAARINDLVEQLTGARPGLADPMQAGSLLAQLFDRQPGPVLLVIDDAWTGDQLDPLLGGGRRCQRLVVTRNRALVPAACSVHVDRMDRAEAAALLTRGIDQSPHELVEDIVEATGHWPVLLSLANRALSRAVRHGTPAAEALADIAGRIMGEGPQTFDLTNLEHRGRLVGATVRAGLDLVPDSIRDRFFELAVFSAGADIPVSSIGLLWGATGGLSAREVSDTCATLADLSLVSRYRAGRLNIHDVIQTWLVHEHRPSELVALHRRFLDEAERLTSGSSTGSPTWWTMPRGFDHVVKTLAGHLHAAGRDDELMTTVTDLRWVATRLVRHGLPGPEADLSFAAATPEASALMTALRLNAHLLIGLDDPAAVAAVLTSRFEKIPELAGKVSTFAATLGVPRLANRWPLPGRPHPALVRTFRGPADPVKGILISPDESLAVTFHGDLSSDGVARLWDIRSGLLRRELPGHSDMVYMAAISPDGRLLATADSSQFFGSGATIRIWQLPSGELRHVRSTAAAALGHLVFAPDSRWLAAAGRDHGSIHIIDVATGDVRDILRGFRTDAVDMAVAPDSSWLAVGDFEGLLTVLDPATGEQRFTIDTGRVLEAIAVAGDGSWIATGHRQGHVRIWNAADGAALYQFAAPGTLSALFTIAQGSLLVSYSRAVSTGDINAWSTVTWQELSSVSITEPAEVAARGDTTLVATGHNDGSMALWNMTEGRMVWKMSTGRARPIRRLALPRREAWILSGDVDGRVCMWNSRVIADGANDEYESAVRKISAVWAGAACFAVRYDDGRLELCDLGSGRALRVLSDRKVGRSLLGGPQTKLVGPPDGSWLAANDGNRCVSVWDPATGEVLFSVPHVINHGNSRILIGPAGEEFQPVAAVPDLGVLITGEKVSAQNSDGLIRIWDAQGTLVHTLPVLEGGVGELAVAPDRTWLASSGDTWFGGSAGDNRRVDIWEVGTWRRRFVLEGHDRVVSQLLIGPSGAWILTRDGPGTLRLWRASDGALLHLADGPGPHWTVAISPCGQWISASRRDGVVRTWDTETGGILEDLVTAGSAIHVLTFSPAGLYLCGGSDDGDIYVWRTSPWGLAARMRIDDNIRFCDWFPDSSGLLALGHAGVYALNLLT